MATIAQRVRWQECWGAEDFRWRTQGLGSAGRQGVGSQQTFESGIWTFSPSVKSTTADWRWSLMASLCSGVRRLPSTQPWCLQSGATGTARRQCARSSLPSKEAEGVDLPRVGAAARSRPAGGFGLQGGGDNRPKSHGTSWLAAAKARSEPEFEGSCGHCGKWGHKQKYCR